MNNIFACENIISAKPFKNIYIHALLTILAECTFINLWFELKIISLLHCGLQMTNKSVCIATRIKPETVKRFEKNPLRRRPSFKILFRGGFVRIKGCFSSFHLVFEHLIREACRNPDINTASSAQWLEVTMDHQLLWGLLCVCY